MKKIILVLFALMLCSNCSATSSMDDYKKAKAQHETIQIQTSILDAKYVNLPKENIIVELGKPYKILKEESPYFLDQSCRKNGCPLGQSDEFWIYQFQNKDGKGVHSYQILVFIKEGKIVRIEG